MPDRDLRDFLARLEAAGELRRITEPGWIADTQRKIKLMGQWPATFPQQEKEAA